MIWLYTFIVLAGTFVAVLGITSVNVAMPKMIAPLSTDVYGVEWVSISYLVSTAITILTFNHFTKLYGLKKIYLAGLLFFALGSALAGEMSTIGSMIVARSIQGIGEGFLIPAAQAIIFRMFPPEKRGLAMGFYAMGVAFAPGLGPTIGGYLVEYISWRAIFYMNLPFIIPIFFASLILLPDFHDKFDKKPKFNYVSFGFLAIASTSFIVMMSKGEEFGWFGSRKIITLFVLFVLGVLLFLLSELLSKNKLVGFDLFKKIEFDYAVITFVLVYGLSFFQILYIMPIYMERIRDIGTFQTGIYVFPFAIGIVLFSPIGGSLSDRIDPRILLLVCQAVLFVDITFFLRNIDYFTPLIHIVFYMFFVGVGMGLFFAPLTAMALKSLQPELIPIGSAFYNYARLFGAAAGTSIATNLFTTHSREHYDNINNAIYPNYHTFLERFYYELASKFDFNLFYSKASLGELWEKLSESYAVGDVMSFSSKILFFGISFTLIIMYFSSHKKLQKK